MDKVEYNYMVENTPKEITSEPANQYNVPPSSLESKAAAASPVSAHPPYKRTGFGANSIAWFSLACSIIVLLLLVTFVFAGKNQIEKTRMVFGERIQKESTTLDFVKEQVGQSTDLYKDLKTRFDLLEQAQKEANSQRVSLEEVYNSLLASRTEVSLSEIEQLVSIAKRQLYLLGNVKGSAVALSQAIDLLEKTDKPSLMGLRAALESDLAEIQSVPSEDLLKWAVSLDSVVNSVEGLPMYSGPDLTKDTNLAELTEEEPAQAVSPAVKTPSTSFMEALWMNVKSVAKVAWNDVKSLVEITKVKSPDVLMLSNRQEIDIRNTLRLSLLNARISLLSRQSELLKSDLKRSSELLETYFDKKSPQVERSLSVLNHLDEIQIELALPELKNSTAALRLALAAQKGDSQ